MAGYPAAVVALLTDADPAKAGRVGQALMTMQKLDLGALQPRIGANPRRPEDDAMKYMLMMNAPGKTPYQIFSWPKQDIEAHIAFMRSFAKKLAAEGELVSAEGLAGPDQARLVRGGSNGEPVTDGIFPETKEFLVGFWMIDVDSTERAFG